MLKIVAAIPSQMPVSGAATLGAKDNVLGGSNSRLGVYLQTETGGQD
jgi:hypothetical protein